MSLIIRKGRVAKIGDKDQGHTPHAYRARNAEDVHSGPRRVSQLIQIDSPTLSRSTKRPRH